MPVDKNVDDEEVAKDEKSEFGLETRKRRFNEFDCPACDANNPVEGSFGDGEQVSCSYCGQELDATVNNDGKLKLRPT